MTPEERNRFKESWENRFGRRWCPPKNAWNDASKDEAAKEQPGTGTE
ncbi:hypothetical protein [Paraflavitalea speifideaquila]|nr:hypothetical protein [Paraflavitalea speifideiaquila]